MASFGALMMPTVHLVDDDDSFLRSMARLLSVSGYRVFTHHSADAFLKHEARHGPGCVVTDLQMPDKTGLELQAELNASDQPMPVVFLTGRGDIPSSVRAMRGGTEDFLMKRTSKEELIDAVERALQRDCRQRSTHALTSETRKAVHALSLRERQVLVGIVRGLLNKQIADALGLAERTVKLHRTTLTRRLGISSPAQLALMLERAGIRMDEIAPDLASAGAHPRASGGDSGLREMTTFRVHPPHWNG
jgi:FixJ family two-component response regulator